MSNYFCLGKARENLLGNQVIKSKSEFLKRGREEGRTETKTLNCFMQLLFFLSHCHDCFRSLGTKWDWLPEVSCRKLQ